MAQENWEDKYKKAKAENKRLKGKIKDINTELDTCIQEALSPCKHTLNDINNHGEVKDIADAYNKAANTAWLIYTQKLKYIRNIYQDEPIASS